MKNKQSFNFTYTKPWLDWYEEVKVTINEKDYDWFKLERRFGSRNSWFIIGVNNQDEYSYRKEKEIGLIWDRDLPRFIEWAKTKNGGSRILEISAISSTFDLLETIKKELL